MSRVRDALKRSDNNLPRERAVLLEQPESAAAASTLPAPAEQIPHATPSTVVTLPAPPKAAQPSLMDRIFGYMLRRFRKPKAFPLPRCAGLTRTGQPCRAPAMANGFCRMHGGSRHGKVVQAVYDLRERVAGATGARDSFGD